MRKYNKNALNIRMNDIAKKASVSKMTVSRAINHPEKVNRSTLSNDVQYFPPQERVY